MAHTTASESISRTTQAAAGNVDLEADLLVPGNATGLVIFAHGSGSSRHSPRNQFVAHALNQADLGTVLVDLLTPQEEALDRRSAHLRFDVHLLADRLTDVADWAADQRSTRHLRIGLFGASTGAAAALITAADRPDAIHAVVSRGGRPDLAGDALARVRAPVLLIVGALDVPVTELNHQALAQMPGEKQLEVVPSATHLFEEPGALQHVAGSAGQWFEQHLSR